MVTEEVHNLEEETRKTHASRFSKQCAWTGWDQVEPKKISWPTLLQMEPLRLSFILRSTYDLLPTASNLKLYGLIDDDKCLDCGQARATLEHVLAGCTSSLTKFTWRHNQVLRVLSKTTKEQCEKLNKDIATENMSVEPWNAISFVREGKNPKKRETVSARSHLLNGGYDWQVKTDLDEKLIFPPNIAITNLRPDIIVWSDDEKKVLLVELTVP